MTQRTKMILIILCIALVAAALISAALGGIFLVLRNDEYEYEPEPAYPIYFRAISAQEGHSLAILDDGTVWAWGINVAGQLGFDGDGSGDPVKVDGIANAVAVFGGRDFSGAILRDGTAWVWGGNMDGQLAAPGYIPTQIETLDNVRNIQVNNTHFAVIKRCGAAYIRRNDEENLVRLELSNVATIAAGPNYMLILTEDGYLYGVGNNEMRHLTASLPGSVAAPTRLPLSDVRAISAGSLHAVAVTNYGYVYQWGREIRFEQRDDGEIVQFEDIANPIRVADLYDIVAVASGNNFTVALQESGEIWGWGLNELGVLGDYAQGLDIPYPRRIYGISNIAKISASGAQFMAVDRLGSLWIAGQKFGERPGGDNAPERILEGVLIPFDDEYEEEP